MAKTEVQVRAVMNQHFGSVDADLRPLVGGEFSRAFAFDAAGYPYVIRVSDSPHAGEVYAKDAWAFRHFASPALPIPRVVARGEVDGLHFAISERASGDRVEVLPPAARPALYPALLDVLDAISSADVSDSRGYGPWSSTGDGEASTWRGFLSAIADNRAEGYYEDWYALFRESFLERDLFDTLYRRMLRLADFCPEERHLLHCDLHFDNILADGRRITGVIDWGNAGYGDPLYDVAWLGRVNALGETFVAPALLDARYGAARHYRERIACYELALGLDDLRFYAKTGRREQYEAIKAVLLALPN
ncbi:MAG TPA: aminoglycoside phosphotransferase family protein [Thermomicrobiales bacterium]